MKWRVAPVKACFQQETAMHETLPVTPTALDDVLMPQLSGLLELDDKALRQVVGGLGPNNGWLTAGPNDGW